MNKKLIEKEKRNKNCSINFSELNVKEKEDEFGWKTDEEWIRKKKESTLVEEKNKNQ